MTDNFLNSKLYSYFHVCYHANSYFTFKSIRKECLTIIRFRKCTNYLIIRRSNLYLMISSFSSLTTIINKKVSINTRKTHKIYMGHVKHQYFALINYRLNWFEYFVNIWWWNNCTLKLIYSNNGIFKKHFHLNGILNVHILGFPLYLFI